MCYNIINIKPNKGREVNKQKAEVIFFSNGSTAVFVNGKQFPGCQGSWFKMFVDFLDVNGIDVFKTKYEMPNGDSAELIKTGNGYNWKMVKNVPHPDYNRTQL